MIETFVVYNKVTGFIMGGGRINREVDNTSLLTLINSTLVEDSNLDVIYLIADEVPNKEEFKIDENELIKLTPQEIVIVAQPRIDEEKIEAEEIIITRATAIQNLKDRGELPTNYKEAK